jgi:hypothetical protein
MTTATDHQPADWPAIVSDCERRNGTVELRLEDDDTSSRTARARLLQVEANGEWLLEKPFSVHGPSFGSGMNVVGVIGTGTRRLGFHAKVTQVELFQLNSEKRIPVLRLTEPTKIHSAQRRAYYRVSAIGADVPVVKLWPLDDPTAAIEAEKANQARHLGEEARQPELPLGDLITGTIFDISGNGISLLIDVKFIAAVSEQNQFWAELRLPGDPEPIRFVLKKVRCTHERHGPAIAAFTFDFEHNPPHQRFVTDLVCRFTAAQQRAQLQRNR